MANSIVITGGTRGIGQGMAREFLRRGHDVCITGRSQGSVDKGLADLQAVTYFTDVLIKENKDSPVNIGFLSPGIVITNLTMQEGDHMTPERWEKTKSIYNIIADKVETVTPWLVDATLADYGKHGSRLAWLTPRKAMGRFFKAFVLRRKRDLFGDLGV